MSLSIVRLGLKRASTSSSLNAIASKNFCCGGQTRRYGILSNITSKVLSNIKIPKLVSTENIDSIITSSDMIIDENVAKGTLAHIIQETILKERELHLSSDPNRTSKTISNHVDGDLKLI